MTILEDALPGLIKAQANVTDLFPQFPARVSAVAKRGGVQLQPDIKPDLWHFEIASGTTAGKKYDAYVHFSNLEDIVRDIAKGNPLVWNKAKTRIDNNKLAGEVLKNGNLQLKCTCAADTFYGFQYNRTKRDSKYTEPETRSPDVRNPGKKGVFCKHLHLLAQTLPFYRSTMAAFLKKYYADMIIDIELEVLDQFGKSKEKISLQKLKQDALKKAKQNYTTKDLQ